MPTTIEALRVLFPTADLRTAWEVTQNADGSQSITKWNLPDPQPSQEQLAAVTADQVKVATTRLYPYELLSLLRPEQVIALQTSPDPAIIILRSKLQTIVSPMPMVGPDMQLAMAAMVGYGIISQADAGKLVRGEPL